MGGAAGGVTAGSVLIPVVLIGGVACLSYAPCRDAVTNGGQSLANEANKLADVIRGWCGVPKTPKQEDPCKKNPNSEECKKHKDEKAALALAALFQKGRIPKASELKKYAEKQGWKPTQTENGPLKYVDKNGVTRLTIKKGSQRTIGSEKPHLELRNEGNKRIDPFGNEIGQRTRENHLPIDYDL